MNEIHSNLILKTFFDSAPMMMGIVELKNNDIIHISDNKVAAKFFGHDQSFMQNKNASELGMPKEFIDNWFEHYSNALKNKTPEQFSYWHLTDQGLRHFSATVSFIGISENDLPRFSYIVQDSTEAMHAQESYKQQEIFLETVLDNIPDMIFVKEASGLRFLKFNKAGEVLLGETRENLVGKNDYDLFPKELADYFTSMDRDILKNKKRVEFPQEPIETKYKGSRILHTKKIPLYDGNGKPLYLVGISEDITDKLHAQETKTKMYEEQVARSEVEKLLESRDEFISIASHELKSPLSSLKLQAQMFKRNIDMGKLDAYSPAKINKMMELTEKQVERLDRLVNDMLDVSRMRTGKLAIELTQFNLYDLIKDVLTRMNEQFGSPKFTFSSTNVIVHWDQMRIEQVLVNLMTNALRYGNNKPFEIKLSQDNERAQFSIHDEGIGIAKDKVDSIFDRFVRAVDLNEVSGLGLGLFISKQIVQAHGGKIWVESVEGKGASFYVDLPLRPSLTSD